LQGLTHIEKGIKHQLLRHDTKQTPRLCRLLGDIDAMHQDRSRRGLGQTGQDTDQRCLACTIGAEQTKELTRLDVKAHAIQGLKRASSRLERLGNRLKGNSGHK